MSSPDSSSLEEVLKRYKTTSSNESGLDFDPLQCTWDDVFRELQNAEEAALESEKVSGKKAHRRVWRGLGDTGADILIPALAAVPDKLCILQGGLGLLFSIARKRSQIRHKILHAFRDIPNLIMIAYYKAAYLPKSHPRNGQLNGIIREFQQTLLFALPALIKKLETPMHKVWDYIKSIDIDDLLEVVRCSSNKVRACAEGITDNLIVETHQDMRNTFNTTKTIQTITENTGVEVGELRGKIDELLTHQKLLQQCLDSISGKNGLFDFLIDYLKPTQCEDQRLPREPLPVYEPATPVTAHQLLSMMQIHHLRALDDEARAIRRGRSMGADAIAHAAYMFQIPRIKQFLQWPESGVVLVNGCMDRSQLAKISPLTYVCATLTQALRRAHERNVVLVFFCGQHSASQDDLLGPQGLVRSFIADLVLALVKNDYICATEQIWFPDIERDFDDLSFEDICKLFYRLVELLPKGITLNCVVDGISFFEQQPNLQGDCEAMIEWFERIISNGQNGATFKLLFTSPTKSYWLSTKLGHDQQVSLRKVRGKQMSNPEAFLRLAFRDK